MGPKKILTASSPFCQNNTGLRAQIQSAHMISTHCCRCWPRLTSVPIFNINLDILYFSVTPKASLRFCFFPVCGTCYSTAPRSTTLNGLCCRYKGKDKSAPPPTVPWFIPISALPLRISLTECMASACSKSLSLLASSVMLTQGNSTSGQAVSPNNIILFRAKI